MSRPIEDGKGLSLKEWLSAISGKKNRLMIDYEFPTEKLRNQYLRTIGSRSDAEVRTLLRKFLIPNCTLGIDRFNSLSAIERFKRNPKNIREYDHRLLEWASSNGKTDPWVGITWVLDLLPHFPRKALNAMDAYFMAHCQAMPDGRLIGFSDAVRIIRAKYILKGDVENADLAITKLTWREFEILTAALYKSMGYKVELTPERGDGGRDVIGTRSIPGMKERCLIQCKKVSGSVGPEVVREILGVVRSERANKGVVVTTSGYTEGSKKFAKKNHVELVDRHDFIRLLNEHLGSTWPLNIFRYVSENEIKE